MRPVHMAMLEAVHVHTGLLPSCSGKASCCGFESLDFQLYLHSRAGLCHQCLSPLATCQSLCWPESLCLHPALLSTMDTGIKVLRRRRDVPWGGLPRAGSLKKQHQTQSLVIDPGYPGCRVAFSQFYQHPRNHSQPSHSIICFLWFSVNIFYFTIIMWKTALLYLNTHCSIFCRFLQLQYIKLCILQLVYPELPCEASSRL